MGRSKGIVDPYIPQPGQFLRKSRIPFFFLFIKTKIFQQQYISRLQGGSSRLSRNTDAVIGELHGATHELTQMRNQMLQGIF